MNDVIPWWQSRTIWAAIVTGLAPLIGTIFHVNLDPGTLQQIVDAATVAATTVASILAIISRIKATSTIATPSNPQVKS